MKYRHFFYLILFIVGCSDQDKINTQLFSPKVIYTKGYVLPKEKCPNPKSFLVNEPKSIDAGKPTISQTNQNIKLAGNPILVKVGQPIVNIVGKGNIMKPISYRGIGTIITAGIPEVVIAKDPDAKDVNPSNFSFYKTLHGLKHNNIFCAKQDRNGNMWFGSNGGGITRFDGKSFTNFTEKEGLSNNVVWSILEDKKGNLWFGTSGGFACKYDGKTFTSYLINKNIENNIVQSIVEDIKGNIWFGTLFGGVTCFDGKAMTNYSTKQGLSNNSVWCISEDRKGNLWFGTSGGGVSKFDGKKFTNYSEKQGLTNNNVNSILEDKKGNLWFGTFGGGVCCFDGNYFRNYSENEGLINNFVNTIIQDKEGELWFGTYGGGGCSFNGKYFTYFSENEGLNGNVVNTILEDKSGSIWFGMHGGGIVRYDGKKFLNYSEKEGISNNVIWTIFEDKSNKIWFGTNGNGVSVYDGNSFTNYSINEGLCNDFINSIIQDKKGNFWFGSFSGFSRFNGKKFTNYSINEGLVNSVINYILEDKKGNIWFATNGGVTKFDGKYFTIYTEKEGLSNNIITTIHEDRKGNLWFGTSGGGVTKFDGKVFTHFTDKQGLANNFILSILEDKKGNLWFGTNGDGVFIYDGKKMINLTEKEGLINNAVLNLLQDNKGNIWCGTRKGLSKIRASNLLNLESNKKNYNFIKDVFFYNYGYNDGFLGLNCRRNSVLQDRKGKIWWGTDVLTCYNPKGDFEDKSAPNINLTSIKLFGEDIVWANLKAVDRDEFGKEIVNGEALDTLLSNGILLKNIKFNGLSKWYNFPKNLILPYNTNNLTFNFIGVHMQSRNHIKYKYKMEGLDSDWSSINDRTEANYGNLPSGEYTFKVKAMNQSGIWSKTLQYKFIINPPWWQTWWFRIIVLFISISVVLFYIKAREKKLIKEKEILEETVEIRTAEVIEEKKIVEDQKHLIEEKHKEIKDSINYAERIQRALLANKKILDENLKNYFIFFIPKDTVSGDFYWATKLNNNHFGLVVADSTGHGVPGAIMSILNIACLDKAVTKGINRPDLILNETRNLIKEYLTDDDSLEGTKDGMDGNLLSFDFENNKLYSASAINPIWIIRNGTIIEIKADRFPIGSHIKDKTPFTLHEQDIVKGDVIYSFTDGFPDQFGGPNGKKFKYKQLQELLLSISDDTMENQKIKLNDVFTSWKGDFEQIDDVCLIGIRI